MMNKYFRLLAVFALLCTQVFAQNAKEQLSSIQGKYKNINDMSVDFRQTVNDKSNFTGKLYYSKQNKFRVELKNTTIVSDGNNVWNYNSSKKQVVINSTDNDSQSMFDIDKFINQYPSKCTVTTEGENGQSVLVLTPNKNSGIGFKKARLWAGKDNLVNRINVESNSGTSMNIELSGYSINKNIPDSKFSFTIPEGIKVIDLRK